MNEKLINYPLNKVSLKRNDEVINLEYSPKSRKIMRQTSSYLNGNVMFKRKDVDAVILQLLHQGWEVKNEETIL